MLLSNGFVRVSLNLKGAPGFLKQGIPVDFLKASVEKPTDHAAEVNIKLKHYECENGCGNWCPDTSGRLCHFVVLPAELPHLLDRLYVLDTFSLLSLFVTVSLRGHCPPALQKQIILPFANLKSALYAPRIRFEGTNIDGRLTQQVEQSIASRVLWVQKYVWDVYDKALATKLDADEVFLAGDMITAMRMYEIAGHDLTEVSEY